jgi:PadR family transcriptional regulator PadR
MKILSRADEILLVSILRLGKNAYGVTIIDEVYRRTGKKLSFGSIWVSLDILSKKGYIDKRLGDPTPQRGGRSKIYYSLRPEGLRALDEIAEFQKALWNGIPNRLKKAGQSK